MLCLERLSALVREWVRMSDRLIVRVRLERLMLSVLMRMRVKVMVEIRIRFTWRRRRISGSMMFCWIRKKGCVVADLPIRIYVAAYIVLGARMRIIEHLVGCCDGQKYLL